MDIIKRRKQKAEAQKRYKLSKKGKITQQKYYASKTKRETNQRWRDNNAIKNRVHQKIYIAIKKGVLKRQPCCVCGNIKSQAHHEDYSKPFDVIWFCNFHHSQYHRSTDKKTSLL